MSVQTAAHTQTRIAGIDAGHFSFAFRHAQQREHPVILQRGIDEFFTGLGNHARRARYFIVLRTSNYMGPEKRAGRTVAENQTEFALSYDEFVEETGNQRR